MFTTIICIAFLHNLYVCVHNKFMFYNNVSLQRFYQLHLRSSLSFECPVVLTTKIADYKTISNLTVKSRNPESVNWNRTNPYKKQVNFCWEPLAPQDFFGVFDIFYKLDSIWKCESLNYQKIHMCTYKDCNILFRFCYCFYCQYW